MEEVKVGQVWEDLDKRSLGRTFRVVEVGDTHATVELIGQRGRAARGYEDRQVARPGRKTRIRLDRFKPGSTGYKLVSGRDGGVHLVPHVTLIQAWSTVLWAINRVNEDLLTAQRNAEANGPGWDSYSIPDLRRQLAGLHDLRDKLAGIK